MKGAPYDAKETRTALEKLKLLTQPKELSSCQVGSKNAPPGKPKVVGKLQVLPHFQ